MNTFILMYIAILLSLYTVAGKILLLSSTLPGTALIATIICYVIYIAIRKAIERNNKIHNETLNILREENKHTFNYHTNETDAERKARVNAEVDKIIEEQRNNKKQS